MTETPALKTAAAKYVAMECLNVGITGYSLTEPMNLQRENAPEGSPYKRKMQRLRKT
jgi:hypothetical protein